MKANHGSYLLYFVALAGMLTVGLLLQSWQMHAGLALSELLCILLPALLFRYWKRDDESVDWPSYRKLGMRPRWLIWVAVTAALIGIGANVVTGIVIEIVPGMTEIAKAYEEQIMQLLQPEDPVKRAVGIASVVVLAPLCEEVLFRGTILPAQRSGGMAVGAAIVLNGLLFSLLHVNPFALLALWAVGAFFAHLVVLTRSVWPAIFAHAVLNGVNGVLAPALIAGKPSEAVEPSLLELAGGAALIVPLVILAWFYGARFLKRDLEEHG